ncbi:DUF4845 domain-containing protein [Candidatus Berkiella aquae]|uniref:DUF4845 domain-containing protein n=1 Tax=Candidatus Berkiella aquae TaxID=295108 RepID=A0A0Q9YU55_9GAMM|nr:DUF4845 domain-containing protein [Candidatus Berkiella aquae]MCS5711084.1 DUF4845 domain-containing protein [Candidatus Berkiella aquae]
MKSDSKKNKGISILGMLITIVIICFGVMLLIDVVPPYMQHSAIQEALKDIAKDANASQMSKAKLRDKLERRLQVESINYVHGDNLEVEKKEGKTYLSLKYERRIPVVANVDFVFKFNDQVVVE